MPDIRTWLGSLGLDQYADTFEANDIEWELLPELTDVALKDIGVSSTGHRLKLLKAARDLDQSTSASSGAEPDAERRQITVMFCDLVGSTALSEELDPEDLRGLMAAYQRAAGAIIERYEGHVAQYLGDGLMTYFGWPQAHEDDAQRSVRAGLEIVQAVKSVPAPRALSVRIGIETGSVVVGETGGGDASVPKLAVGEAPNLAARVQSLAQPDQVLIGPTAHRLVAGLFEYDDLGNHTLKGILDPVRVRRVVSEIQTETRFDADRGAASMTPLVGRGDELDRLMSSWNQAASGKGQVVVLAGEPGIGKSRVIRELVERLKPESRTRTSYQCSPFHTNSVLYPVIKEFEHAAGFTTEDDASGKLAKMEARLHRSVDDIKVMTPLFAAMLSLPTEGYQALDLNPEEQKRRSISAYIEHLTGFARPHPLLVLFEDAHWADATTLETLDALVTAAQSTRILVIITHRPEFEPRWTAFDHVTRIALEHLSKTDGAEIVKRIIGGKSLPDEVLDQIVAKTDGVPLFVEELTKSVLEGDYLVEGAGGYELAGSTADFAISTTVQDALMARLDRLAEATETAQIGATIGREFSLDLISKVAAGSEHNLSDALGRLCDSGLIFEHRTGSNVTYTFKHALTQDTAYRSLLKSKRQTIHTEIAHAIENEFPLIVATHPELVAYHFAEAGQAGQASAYWYRAGQRASERSANHEAVGHLTAGLSELEEMPDAPDRARQELALQIALGSPLQALKGQASSEPAEVFRRARALSAQTGDTSQLSSILHGLHAFHIVRGELPQAQAFAEECYDVASREDDDALLAAALFVMGCVSFHTAETEAARKSFEKAVALDTATGSSPRVLPAGLDLKVFGQSYLSHTAWFLGYPDKAMAWSRAAADYAADRAHYFGQAVAGAYSVMLMQFLGDAPAAFRQAENLVAFCAKHNFAYYLAWARVIRGWARAKDGHDGDGISEMREGLDAIRETGAGLRHPYYLGILAETLGAAGQTEDAFGLLANAQAIAADKGEDFFTAELHRIDAVLQSRLGKLEASEISFQRAIDLARGQQARSLELRAAIGLARLWQFEGRSGDARDLVTPIYDGFGEGFATPDLQDTKILLDAL